MIGLLHARAARSVAVLFAVLLGLAVPLTASAASSGGWTNLGHGASASSPALNQKVETLLHVGTKLYVGGDFINAAGIAGADHIAVWNGSAWSAVGAGLGDAPSAVYAIAVDGNNVYAGGSFQNAGGDTHADGVAVHNASGWHSLGGESLGTVFALAILGRTLYVGGSFGDAAGIPSADAIAAYNLDSHVWSSIQANSGQLATVSSIIPDGHGGLFVGGNFANAEGIAQADYVAEWNGGVSWSSVGASVGGTDGALNNRVRGLSRSGDDLYVVGDFTNARGIAAADKVAHWDGSAWSSLGSFSAFGDAGATALYGVLAIGSSVFVTGNLKNGAGNARIDGIAGFVNGDWVNVGTNAAGNDGPVGNNSSLFALAAVGPRLYAGGIDSAIGGSTLNAYIGWFHVRQPDALLSAGAQFVGNGIHNATAQNQSITKSVARGDNITFNIALGNDGLAPDTLKVKGPGSGSGFTVQYLDGFSNTNVTSQVVAGTFQLSLPPRTTRYGLKLKVTVGAGVPLNTTHSWLIRESSTAGGAIDAVKAIVKANP